MGIQRTRPMATLALAVAAVARDPNQPEICGRTS